MQRAWGSELDVPQETDQGEGLMGLARELEHSGLGRERCPRPSIRRVGQASQTLVKRLGLGSGGSRTGLQF